MHSRAKFRKTSATSPAALAAPELLKPFYEVREAATILNKSVDTIPRYCKTGKLAAIPEKFGTRLSFRIPRASIQAYFLEEEIQRKQVQEIRQAKIRLSSHSKLLDKFESACYHGLITGKAFSKATVDAYLLYLRKFFEDFETVSFSSLRDHLIVTDTASKREKIHRAVVCYAKFLVAEGVLGPQEVEKLKELKPEPNKDPKRLSLTEAQLASLEAACPTLQDRLTVVLLSQTGLRASEFTGLKVEDFFLPQRGTPYLSCLGKGGKRRRVGLPPKVKEMLTLYLQETQLRPYHYLFPNDLGQQMTRWGLRDRLRRIGKVAKVTVHPHALRRAFVTINANKGRSLVIIQLACGHSKIETTRQYCRTSEQEMLEAMENWN